MRSPGAASAKRWLQSGTVTVRGGPGQRCTFRADALPLHPSGHSWLHTCRRPRRAAAEISLRKALSAASKARPGSPDDAIPRPADVIRRARSGRADRKVEPPRSVAAIEKPAASFAMALVVVHRAHRIERAIWREGRRICGRPSTQYSPVPAQPRGDDLDLSRPKNYRHHRSWGEPGNRKRGTREAGGAAGARQHQAGDALFRQSGSALARSVRGTAHSTTCRGC